MITVNPLINAGAIILFFRSEGGRLLEGGVNKREALIRGRCLLKNLLLKRGVY